MELDDEMFESLSKLCRIYFEKAEKEDLQANLDKFLKYVETLNEVDTEGVLPCNHVLEAIFNVMREDLEGELLPREAFIANSPDHVGGMIKVPPVIKFEE